MWLLKYLNFYTSWGNLFKYSPRHNRLHKRSKVLVLDCPFPSKLIVREPRAVRSKSHALVLEVALPPLIADGAVQRVVDKQELHHPLPRLPGEV